MLTVGVDLGGTNIYVLAVGESDEVRGQAKLRTPISGDREAVMDVMEAAIQDALDGAGPDLADVDAIGIGTPGVVIDGTIGGATNVPGWFDRFGLAEVFGHRIGKPVRIANDVTAASVAEHRFGAGAGTDHLLAVFVGTGVGSGLILNGEPYEGGVGGAGEFGHTIVSRGGAVCPCGRRGCVEAYAGRRAMAQAAERAVAAGHETILFDIVDEQDKRRPTSGVFREALERGDTLTADLVDEGIAALGAGIASAVNLLDVDVVVIGGGLADKLGERFMVPLEAAVKPHLFLQPPRVELVTAELADEAGALGVAVLARDLVDG